MESSQSEDIGFEECKAIRPFLALFPSITIPPSVCKNSLSDGVLLFDALSDVSLSYFDPSCITRDFKDNYILKQSNLRKLLRSLQKYLRVERMKMICFPTEDMQGFILNIVKDQSWDYILFLLELVTAVAVTSDQRTIFVGRVREMPTTHQVILKDLIQHGLTHLQDYYDKGTFDDSSGREEEEEEEEVELSQDIHKEYQIISQPLHHHHGRHSFESEINQSGIEDDVSITQTAHFITIEPEEEYIQQLQNKLVHLQELHAKMEKDMALQQEREHELCSKLSALSARHKAELMQAESLVMDRERALQEMYERKVADLEKALKHAQASLVENNNYKQRVLVLEDELDVLKHARDKAVQSEDHVKRLKEKLESLHDVNECLKREETAHSETIEKCIRLESEISLLLPLRRQLDDYKSRLVEVEIKLAEYEQDNATWRRKHDQLSQENAALLRGSSQLKEEELSLRRQLVSDPDEYLRDTASIGVGLSELNPELKVELARLRKENEHLKVFASKRENDHVQKIEDKVEDLNLLSQKLKEQYLQNKLALDESLDRERELHQQLTDALYREEALKTDLIALQSQFELEKEDLVQKAIHERNKLEEELLTKLSSEQHRLQEKLDEITREKVEIDQRASAALLDSERQHESDLEKLRFQHQQQIDEVLRNNEENRISLMEKGKHLIKKQSTDHKLKLKEMELKCKEVEDKCEENLALMKRKMDAFENEAKNKFAATQKAHQSSLERLRVVQDKCEDLEEECNLLKREKSNIEGELDRQRRRRMGTDNGQGYLQYEQLQREFQAILNENRQLKDQLNEKKRSQEMASIALRPSAKQNIWTDALSSSNLSLAELRSNYEETISLLTDEKRELIMKNAAVIADAKKAQQQNWDLEEMVGRLSDELTSVKLKLERATENAS